MKSTPESRPVGQVVGLWRYPVKSMAAEAVDEVEVSWHGLIGDRRWALIRDGAAPNGFPWFTLREKAEMGHYLPSFVDPTRPDKSPTVVRTPSGDVFDIRDPALRAELCPEGTQVIKQSRGIFDTFPLSLITTQTIARLGERVDTPLDVQRFRPNILVQTFEDAPFIEDTWVSSILQIGGIRMRVDKRDGRCVVINIDPVTGERNTAILRAVARERQGCLGVYGTTVEPGRVALGDQVTVEPVARPSAELSSDSNSPA